MVLLSIAYCAWLWGPIGAFLAVPLLIVMTVTIEYALGDVKPAPAP